jgi:hypothetical protein
MQIAGLTEIFPIDMDTLSTEQDSIPYRITEVHLMSLPLTSAASW